MSEREFFHQSISLIFLLVCNGCHGNPFVYVPSPDKQVGRVLNSGLQLEIETLKDPDFDALQPISLSVLCFNQENMLQGKYLIRHIESRLKARGFNLSAKEPAFVMTVWASEKPFSYWIPGYSYWLPNYQAGSTRSSTAVVKDSLGFQVGTVEGSETSAGTWSSSQVVVPGREESSNGRYIKIQVFRTKDLKKNFLTPVWEGKVWSTGESRLMDVYETLGSELTDEFPNGTNRQRKRIVPLEQSFDQPAAPEVTQ